MIDLNKIEKEIDKLFEKETSNSLTNWLLNKRFKNINVLLGKGSFVNMATQNGVAVFSNKNKAVFNKKNSSSDNNPITRKAA